MNRKELLEQMLNRAVITSVSDDSDVLPALAVFFTQEVYSPSRRIDENEVEAAIAELATKDPWSAFTLLTVEAKARLQKRSPFVFSLTRLANLVDQQLLAKYEELTKKAKANLSEREEMLISNLESYDGFRGNALEGLRLEFQVFATIESRANQIRQNEYVARTTPAERDFNNRFVKAAKIYSTGPVRRLANLQTIVSLGTSIFLLILLSLSLFGTGPFESVFKQNELSMGEHLCYAIGFFVLARIAVAGVVWTLCKLRRRFRYGSPHAEEFEAADAVYQLTLSTAVNAVAFIGLFAFTLWSTNI